MSFAEVFLRLGLGLVGWMVLYAHYLWLAAARRVGCGPDGDEMFALLLGFAPVAAAFAFATLATRPFDEIHRILRWLGIPLLLLAPFGVMTTWWVSGTVFVEGRALCAPGGPPLWQQLWAPAQLATLVVTLVTLASAWRRADSIGA
jgi:hypothetical protein